MRPRHAVLLTEHAAKHAHPERASRAEGSLLAASLPIPAHPTQLLSRQHIVRVSSLDATLMSSLVNGAIKGLKTWRSEEHTSELQSPDHLLSLLLLQKKNKNTNPFLSIHHP